MEKKINLGCGPIGKEDWINIDWGILAILHKYSLIEKALIKLNLFPKSYNVVWPKNLKLYNCRKRLPFADNSIDYIYASHFLEHLKKFEAERVVNNCFRVLKKGAVIRVIVPDLELLVEKYCKKDIDYFKKLSNLISCDKEKERDSDSFLFADIFMDNFYPHFYKTEFIGIKKLMTFFIRPHCWMYDYESLKHLLEAGGLKNVRKKAFREGRVPDLDYLDVFPEMSLYVEAEK